MRVRSLGVLLVGGAMALSPVLAFAQEAPNTGSDATFGGGPPAQSSQIAMDACGNPMPPASTFTGTENAGMPATVTDLPLGNAPMDNGVNPDIPVNHNLSQVTGTILHGEGTLLLVQQPVMPAAGTANPAPSVNQAVIQLPNDCSASSFDVGQHITAVGTPTQSGILAADSIQAQD